MGRLGCRPGHGLDSLPELFIAMTWQPLYPPVVTKTFFISYKSEERGLAEKVADGMIARGQQVWRDSDQLRTSERWWDEIERALASCDDVVVLLSRRALESEIVVREIKTAVRLGRLVHIFTETDLRETSPGIYEMVGDLHHARFSTKDALAETSSAIVSEVLADGQPAHPLLPAAFFKQATIRVFPQFQHLQEADLMGHGWIERYRGYADLPFAQRSASRILAANFALLAACQKDWNAALKFFKQCGVHDELPYIGTFFALCLLRGRHPQVSDAYALDKVENLLRRAFGARQSPLIGCFLTWVLGESGRARGPKLEATAREARANLAIELPSERVRFQALTNGRLLV